ncbi:MAG: hypothetical protein Kow0026_10070 [Oricola sp.]
MTRPAFGQREAKALDDAPQSTLKDHARYVRGSTPGKKPRRRDGSVIDRVLAWLSYFTLVFTAVVALTPDSAAGAVVTVHRIVTTAVPA